jgi:hypothetical protein
MPMAETDRGAIAALTRIFASAMELRAAVYRKAPRHELDALRARAASILEGYLDDEEAMATRRLRED